MSVLRLRSGSEPNGRLKDEFGGRHRIHSMTVLRLFVPRCPATCTGTPADARIRHLRTPRRDAAEHNVLGSSRRRGGAGI